MEIKLETVGGGGGGGIEGEVIATGWMAGCGCVGGCDGENIK